MLVFVVAVQDLKLPFIKKKDLEKRKEEMKKSIGLLSKQRKKTVGKSKLSEIAIEHEIVEAEKGKTGAQPVEIPKQEKEKKVQHAQEKKEQRNVAAKMEKIHEKKQAETTAEPPDIFKKKLPMFYFWYCNLKASNLLEFENAVRNAPQNSLYHHASNHDFSKWLEKDIPNSFIVELKTAEGQSKEKLREALLSTIAHFKKPKSVKNTGNIKKEEKKQEKKNEQKELKEPLVTSL